MLWFWVSTRTLHLRVGSFPPVPPVVFHAVTKEVLWGGAGFDEGWKLFLRFSITSFRLDMMVEEEEGLASRKREGLFGGGSVT